MPFSSARTGKCDMTSIGEMFAARTRTLAMTNRISNLYPFSFLRMDFTTSFTPRRVIFTFEAKQEVREQKKKFKRTYPFLPVSELSFPKTYQPEALQSGTQKWTLYASCCWILIQYQTWMQEFDQTKIDWEKREKGGSNKSHIITE